MAKQVAADAEEQRPRRKVLRQLKKTQTRHEKAERRVGKLRLRLERAEAKLAERAQRLLLVQAKLHPGDDHPEPAHDDRHGESGKAAAEHSVPVTATAAPVTANGDSPAPQPVAATPRRARTARPRTKRRPAVSPAGN